MSRAAASVVGQALPDWAFGTMFGLPLVATETRTSRIGSFVPVADIQEYQTVMKYSRFSRRRVC